MKRALALLLLPSVAFAGDLFLKSKTIDVVGVAPISKNNLALARQQAVADAQRNAVEQVLGTAIESTFSATQRETLKGKHSQFVSDVSARVKTKTTGFIDGYTVVSEKRVKDTLRVRLKVKVTSPNEQYV